MTEVLLPPWIEPEKEPQEPLDEGSSVFGAQFAPGLAQRQSYGGLRPKFSRFHTVRGEEKAQLIAALKSTRGRYNSLRTRIHQPLRGSFQATEILSNGMFDGSTGWTTVNCDLKVEDRIGYVVASRGGTGIDLVTTATMTQYAPHVLRAYIADGRGTSGLSLGPFISGGLSSNYSTARGLVSVVRVPSETGSQIHGVSISSTSGFRAGDFIAVPYVSLTRCPLIDNGTNLLLRSDELDNAAWTKMASSITAGATAPDGTSSADIIVENAANSSHFVQQSVTVSSSAADYAFAVAVRQSGRTFAGIQLTEATSGTSAEVTINLTTGAVTEFTPGANWSNLRSFAVDLGDDWWYVCIVARKTNAATTVNCNIYALDDGDGTFSYAGDGTSGIRAWRATLAQSSVPVRLVQTTSAASTGTSQTGNALHIKGLPESEDGLLLPEDWFEINGELKQCTAALNSDAAGLGYLQFEPALFRSPSDNDPVIVKDPMGKFLVSNIQIDNEFGVQARVSYDIEHIYE